MFFVVTVVTMNIVEKLAENCMVFHQTHKRVWPATQRDSLYYSYMTKIDDVSTLGDYSKEKGFRDCWMVCNESIDHDGGPPVSYAQTLVCSYLKGVPPDEKLSSILCRLSF